MTDQQKRIDELLQKLEAMARQQESFALEITRLQGEIRQLQSSPTSQGTPSEPQATDQDPKVEQPAEPADFKAFRQEVEAHRRGQKHIPSTASEAEIPKDQPPSQIKHNLEKFIGENLINKIGIAITVIGVGIGAKYAIDNQLISPLTRIVLGYLVGLGLLAFAIRLKKDYHNFSAVLLSGAMAIMYFITFAAYSFYDLFPQAIAFAIMVLFTGFTVAAALNYSRQVIAHFGLVGAYAVPFLLSKDSGNALVLFSYVAIINGGILAISFRRYWKPLLYSSFVFSWLIYAVWYLESYSTSEHFGLGLSFVVLFFFIFYMSFLAYKLGRREKFQQDDIILLLANSFIFYGFGYSILSDHASGEQLLGLFTLANGLVHFMVATVIYRKKLGDRNMFFFVAGLVLLYLTIAIPVQLDGNWVTLLWVGEAAVLFWVGRTRQVKVYQRLAYPLMLLAFASLVHDWLFSYSGYYPENPATWITPIFNIHFLSSALFTGAFSFILHLNQRPELGLLQAKGMERLMSYLIPGILLIVIYWSFRLEIDNYWHQRFADTGYENYDLVDFQSIWGINYSLFYFTTLTAVNLLRIKNQQLAKINLVGNALVVVTFLFLGLMALSELRESFINQALAQDYNQGPFHLIIRYVSLVFVAALLASSHRYTRAEFFKPDISKAFDLALHLVVLWIASSELIHWLDLAGSSQAYKLGLTILWGFYSLLVIGLGIWRKKKFLRIAAISLFGVTLLKLFFYDIADLDTIAKTVVLVALGVLLLIISFLYNKYKHIIADDLPH